MCNAVLTPHEARAGFLCSKPACAWQYRTVPAARRCAECARPLTAQQHAGPVCDREQCRRTYYFDRIREQREGRQRDIVDGVMTWLPEAFANTALPAGARDLASYRITAVWHTHGTVWPSSAKRREALRAHLEQVVAEAYVHRALVAQGEAEPYARVESETESDAMNAVLGAACAYCGGNCCWSGGDHGYLIDRTIDAYLTEHPASTPNNVVDAYLAHVPDATMAGSCVFHGPEGCGLPRAMRSDTCNMFLCDGLTGLTAEQRTHAEPRAFVVKQRGDPAAEGMLVSPLFTQLVRAVRVTEPVAATLEIE